MTSSVPGQKENVRLAEPHLAYWTARKAKRCLGFDKLTNIGFTEVVDAAAADHS